MKDYLHALADYDQALQIKPKLAETLLNRGHVLRALGRFDASLADFDEVVALQPNYAAAHLGRAAMLQKLRRNQEASAACDEAIRLDPKFVNARTLRSMCRYSRGDWAGALSDFDEAIRLDPKYALAHNGRALVLSQAPDDRLRDGGKAVESATRACELSGGKVPLYVLTLAFAQAEKGDFDAALVTLDKLDEILPPLAPLGVLRPELRKSYRAKTPLRIPFGGFPQGPFQWVLPLPAIQ